MSALSKVRGVIISQDDTRRMEDEARKMELKMELLRKTLDGGDATRKPDGATGGSGGRWRSGAANKPLRNGYVKDVLDRKPARRREESGTRSRDAVPATSSQHPGSQGASAKTTPRPAEVEASGTFANALAVDCLPTASAPANKAASNLQAALKHQSRESLEVEAFLAGLGLDRYVSLFMEHGFDCMDVVKEMEESHMKEIGMAIGHIMKLRKRLSEMGSTAASPAPSAPAVASRSGTLSGTNKKVSFGGAEQAVRSPVGGTAAGTGAGGDLLNGNFDEDESKASFQDAVRAWREGKTSNEGSSSKPAASDEGAKAATGSFWSTVGEGDVSLERCSTPLTAPSDAIKQNETQHDPAPGEDKLCCYQCYKQFFAKFACERTSPLPGGETRRLCSEHCAKLWVASMQAKASEVQQRQEKMAKMEEMRRVIEHDMKVAESIHAEPVLAA